MFWHSFRTNNKNHPIVEKDRKNSESKKSNIRVQTFFIIISNGRKLWMDSFLNIPIRYKLVLEQNGASTEVNTRVIEVKNVSALKQFSSRTNTSFISTSLSTGNIRNTRITKSKGWSFKCPHQVWKDLLRSKKKVKQRPLVPSIT